MLITRTRSIIKSFTRYNHIFIDHYDISSTGISLNEFHQRRQLLVNLIRNHMKTEQKQSSINFTIYLPSSIRLYMGPDVAYFPYKQQSDFYYLTGCMQPDSVLVLQGDEKKSSTSLFLPQSPMNSIEQYERWFGPTITDKNQICQLFGIDHVYPIDKLLSIKIPSSSKLFYNSQSMNDTSINQKYFIPFLNRFSTSIASKQLNIFLDSLRSIKSPSEQNLIRHACELTSKAFIQTIRNIPKNTSNECFIKARFQYECEILGETSMAFHPVVAAGGRSNVMHYHKNNQSINKDDLIMLDGGCLFKQYSSDITRFWPLNGRFSSAHRQLYEILLTVQKDLIQYLNTDNKTITRQELNILSDRYMIKYLREELILSRTIDDSHAGRIISFLCPTSVSHHLGLDTHDCESISFSEPLRPGNVITIEPGIYIPFNCTDVPSIYRGFATRIEDDILLTEQGCEVLTKTCPREIDDLYKILDERDK